MKKRKLHQSSTWYDTPLRILYLTIAIVFIGACTSSKPEHNNETLPKLLYDSHVHLMSPQLISDWKELGIPFSKTDANYSNIDTILDRSTAQRIDLIGMAYVYENPDYYQGRDGYEKMIAENDYLFETAAKYPKRISPYFAIDPLRESALTEIERCINIQPNAGLKLHFNASQVYLTEPNHLKQVKRVFIKSAEYGLPVLLHFDNGHPRFGRPDLELLVDSILTQAPAMSLRFAHFGTSGGFNNKTKRFIDAYLALKRADRIPSRHNIYFDISAVALDKDSEGVSELTRSEFKELANYVRKLGIEHIVFGTDYPLYTGIDYLAVLREKLQLTDQEMDQIMNQKITSKSNFKEYIIEE